MRGGGGGGGGGLHEAIPLNLDSYPPCLIRVDRYEGAQLVREIGVRAQ